MSRQLPQAASEDVQMPEDLNTGRGTSYTRDGPPVTSEKRARGAKERLETIFVFDRLVSPSASHPPRVTSPPGTPPQKSKAAWKRGERTEDSEDRVF